VQAHHRLARALLAHEAADAVRQEHAALRAVRGDDRPAGDAAVTQVVATRPR
jgi:hypothetical protein